MAQQLVLLAALLEEQGSAPNNHMVAHSYLCNSRSKGSNALFRPPEAPSIHAGKIFIHKIVKY